MAVWWHKIIFNILSSENITEISLHIIDTIVGIITLIIVFIGYKAATSAFEKYKEKRQSAIWDFYTDLSTFTYRLRLTIGSKDNPSNVTQYLYTGKMPTSNRDVREVRLFEKLSDKFLDFLSTGNGQVPITDNFKEWEKHRNTLIKFLNTALYIGVRVDIVDADAKMDVKEKALKKEINTILDTIDFIEKGVNKVIDGLKNEIDGSR